MSTPPRRRSAGRGRTRRCRGWRTGPCAGSARTPAATSQREVRRGSRYDGIILDPPKYGRGPTARSGGCSRTCPSWPALCAELAVGQRLVPAAQRLCRADLRRGAGLACWPRTSPDRGGRIDWGELTLVEDSPGPPDRHVLLWPVGGMSRAVTSLTNPTVKAVRALHLRKEREETGLFVAEGLKIVTEAVELGHAPRILMYGQDAAEPPPAPPRHRRHRATRGEVIEVTHDILAKVSRRDNPQAVVGVFAQVVHAPRRARRRAAAPCFVGAAPGARPRQPRDHRPHGRRRRLRRGDPGGRLLRPVLRSRRCAPPWARSSPCRSCGRARPSSPAWRPAGRARWSARLLTAEVDHRQATYAKPALVLMGNEQQGL